MSQRFVHLRLHTEYSLIDGLVRIKPLMSTLKERHMNAVAITDHCNLFATIKFFKNAIASGIKPIIGSDLQFYYPDKPEQLYSIILLCQTDLGYKNLTRLISKAYLEGQSLGKPTVCQSWIAPHAEGLIALSGGRLGDIGHAIITGDLALANARTKQWMTLFSDRFYLEVQRTERQDESLYNQQIVKIAQQCHLPLVATNDVCFLNAEDFEAHEARVCIHEGYSLADPRRTKRYSAKQYLKSADEMIELFHDLPQAIENTIEISKRCNVRLTLGKNYLPNFPVPQGFSVEEYLSKLAKEGLENRLKSFHHDTLESKRLAYFKRLELELNVINTMGFAGYFLIVADFIQWAKNNGVPVGPGRGSGAGSLVAYSLQITDLEPITYDLLFERFLNPERVSMPDFDIDFCMEGRDRVIEYVAEKYGRRSVSQIITFGTMAAKAVIRDVGRVLGHPYGFVDKLAKLIPFELGITLQKALDQEELLRQRYDEEEEVKELVDLAMKLEGITRNAGKHAGGVVIAPSELTDFTAIYCEQGSSQLVSQFDKDDVESAGLVKFDFLGLRTLTIIDWALKYINQQRTTKQLEPIAINTIALDDPKTFDLLKACQTTAVFQLESRGMKELIHRLQPDCFEDIIALVALFRPGPLQSGMVDDFIDRKHGRAQVIYPHPDLEPILKPTYGVILYQEQVMQIAQVLANYTLGGADLLRRAMGKKKPEEMAKQREIFVTGAKERGVDLQVASSIFDLMEKFAGYGFNKSHSAAYALIAFQTAWLKTHYPAEFMAAVMSSDMDNTDKVVNFINECRYMGLKVLPPSINQSNYHFAVLDEQTIIFGLGAIKGVGEAAIQEIVQNRSNEGDYSGLFNLCKRVDLRKINRRVLEALIKSGSFDEWHIERASLISSTDKAIQTGTRFHQNQQSGQTDLFSLMDDEHQSDEEYIQCQAWSDKQRLTGEKETLGFYLTGHPADVYLEEFAQFVTPIFKLEAATKRKAIICGVIQRVRQVLTKRGKKLAIISIENLNSTLDVVAFSEIFESKSYLIAGETVVIEGEISHDDYNGGLKMTAQTIYNIEEARTHFANRLVVKLVQEDNDKIEFLSAVLKNNPGQCVVQIDYTNQQGRALMNLDVQWRVNPSDELIAKISALFDRNCVALIY